MRESEREGADHAGSPTTNQGSGTDDRITLISLDSGSSHRLEIFRFFLVFSQAFRDFTSSFSLSASFLYVSYVFSSTIVMPRSTSRSRSRSRSVSMDSERGRRSRSSIRHGSSRRRRSRSNERRHEDLRDSIRRVNDSTRRANERLNDTIRSGFQDLAGDLAREMSRSISATFGDLLAR